MKWKDRGLEWHKKFCFCPRLVGEQWVWLETVQRRIKQETQVGPIYEYREDK